LAEVAGPGLSPHIGGTFIPALIIAMAYEDEVKVLLLTRISTLSKIHYKTYLLWGNSFLERV
jgi:hypothetical protein